VRTPEVEDLPPATIVTPEQVAVRVAIGFQGYRRRFKSVTRRAGARFESRDWSSIRRDLLERIDAYAEAVDETIESLLDMGFRTTDRDTWSAARAMFRADHVADPYHEIAETFFNSVARQLFGTEGIDPHLEFLAPAVGFRPADRDDILRTYRTDGDRVELLAELLRDCRFHASWTDLTHDLREGAVMMPAGAGIVEVVDPLFYRGKGAYLVGRHVSGDGVVTPFSLAVRHGRRGLRLGAVLVGEDDLAILFSYTRSAFLVAVDHPAALVSFIRELLPTRHPSEVYGAIGFRKQAKTERFRELSRHLAVSSDRFVLAPGTPGLVMIVFTLHGYDVVFKVIRDRFPPQKQVTPDDVAAGYRIVSRHDRAGRLVEAQRFVDLRLPVGRFEPSVLEELLTEASRTVRITNGDLNLATVYVERKVIPLDVYVRTATVEEATRVVIDYGAAIKNMAASNIFPGDMLLKNFGVTARGRVVFYDYDEIGLITDYRFRELPESDDPYDDLAESPAHGVGPHDVFPEELVRFLGLKPVLREAFLDHHADLFDPGFWNAIKERIEYGEVIEILPYRRSRSLEAP
jgi:isocitrate dehydrogenase kinase/phosphatase